MTNTIQPSNRGTVTVVGGSFQLWHLRRHLRTQPVNNVSTAEYPAHFALNGERRDAQPVDPMIRISSWSSEALNAWLAIFRGDVVVDAGSC